MWSGLCILLLHCMVLKLLYWHWIVCVSSARPSLLSGLLLGCLLLVRVGGSKSVEVQRVWEIYDERLQFMPLCLMNLLVGMMFLWVGLSGC